MRYFISTFIVLFFLFTIVSCNNKAKNTLSIKTINGSNIGVEYSIQYVDSLNRNIQKQIDSILNVINLSVDVKTKNSLVAQFNSGDSCTSIDNHFLDLFLLSDEVYEITDGAFDPTVKPLLDIWGFGDKKNNFDSTSINQKLNLSSLSTLDKINTLVNNSIDHIGWDLLTLKGDILTNSEADGGSNFICKDDKMVQIGFDAIIQGYTVDIISEFLQYKLGINDFIIDFGGRIMAQGKKPDLSKWIIQLENPFLNSSGKSSILNFEMVKYRSISKSNSNKFVEIDGKKYYSFIDPRTGLNNERQIINAVIFANDCAIADAYATSFITMGIEEAVPLIESNPYEGVEAYFTYLAEDGSIETYISTGLEDVFIK